MALRSTFRDAAGDVAWQRQLRDKYLSEGSPAVSCMDVRRSIVRPVSRNLAEQIILKYEWLGTMAPSRWHYGIFFDSYCGGVCCIAVGNGTGGVNSHMEFGVSRGEFSVLARGACVHWAPPGTNSRLVSWTTKLFARDTACKIVIAYADTDAGEIGTIYQACGWVYIGRGARTMQWVSPNGRIYDQKLPSNLRHGDGSRVPRKDYVIALRDAGWTEQPSNPKHRYVCILDKTDKVLASRVERMRQPYPKRAGVVQLAEYQGPPEDGGSIPTRPLMDMTGGEPVLVTNG